MNFSNPFNTWGPDRRQRGPGNLWPSHFGPGHGRHGHGGPGGEWPSGFGPDRRHGGGFGPFGPHGRHGHGGPFGPGGFGPHGGRGPWGPHHHHGGFGPFGPGGRGPWDRDNDYSSSDSEDDEKKKPEDVTSSDTSDSSDSDNVDCHGKGHRHRRGGRHCPHHRGRHGRHGHHGGHCWPPHHHGRHGRGDWPPHHHHHGHHGGHGPWDSNREQDLPVEDASAFGSDYQVIPDEDTSNIANAFQGLEIQNDDAVEGGKGRKNRCFKVALNADGFKAKEIRIRRHQNTLLVEGKQDAKTALGSFQRTFAYTIHLPAGLNPKKIKTKLGVDGVLRIRAKKSRNEDSAPTNVEEITID